MYGGSTRLGPIDHILLSAMEYDIYSVISESANHLTWWFVAHLTDLLYHSGTLQSTKFSTGKKLHEFLLLEYASSIMSHQSLWQVAADYLDHCPEFGLHHLECFLERLPLETDKKAMKVVRMCEQRNMLVLAASICKTMGMRALHEGHLGSALSWCLRSKDAPFATYLSEKFLEKYVERGDFSNLDLLDNLGTSMLLSTRLTFLGKYREFHKLYEAREFAEAGCLLLSLLSAKLAPRKFWGTLLLDVLPLLELEDIIFNSQQTYELLNCLEELTLGKKFESCDSNISADVDMKLPENEKFQILRLALAKNLARTLLDEHSLD